MTPVQFGAAQNRHYQQQLRLARNSFPEAFRHSDEAETYNHHLSNGLVALTEAVEQIGRRLDMHI